MTWTIEGVVAAYAAIVGTGALFLEVRRWWESGARLVISLMVDAQIVGNGRVEKKGLLVATVTNRGDLPTTITNFCILRFTSNLGRWRNRSTESYLIPHPQLEGYPPVIPGEVRPGQQWTGIAHSRSDVVPNIRSGEYYVAIFASHQSKPTLVRIPVEGPKILEGAVTL